MANLALNLKNSIKLIFVKRISSRAFAGGVLKVLESNIYDKEAVANILNQYHTVLENDGGLAGYDNDKTYANLYLQLERHITEEQTRKRISKSDLRSEISRTCKPERAKGDFTLLFLASSSRRIRLFIKFANSVLKRFKNLLGDENYKTVEVAFGSQEFLKKFIMNGRVDWNALEEGVYKEIADKKEREDRIQELVYFFLDKLYRRSSLPGSEIRSEIVFKEAYQQFKQRFNFLEDISQVLIVVPEEILKEERVEIFSKEKLVDELRRRNHELEMTNIQLSEEKEKVVEEKEKLADALERLKVVDKAKSDFITVVTHQFRTPLTVVRWNAELISDKINSFTDEKLKQRFTEYATAINDRAILLIHVLEDIYDVLAIEGGTATVEKKPTQLWEIADDILKEFSKDATNKSLQLDLIKPENLTEEILADPVKIKRVFSILIRNAIQYTPENGNVSVSIQEANLNGTPALSCTIKDTGIGIASENQTKIFDKFFRAENAVKTVGDGAGLGLYLAKHFIDIHGGKLEVQSELGKGSSFIFILPKK